MSGLVSALRHAAPTRHRASASRRMWNRTPVKWVLPKDWGIMVTPSPACTSARAVVTSGTS
jgi:hypothetical protein